MTRTLLCQVKDMNLYEFDVISYTVLIYGFCKTLKVEEAMKLYNKMLLVGQRLDMKTYMVPLLKGLFFLWQRW